MCIKCVLILESDLKLTFRCVLSLRLYECVNEWMAM